MKSPKDRRIRFANNRRSLSMINLRPCNEFRDDHVVKRTCTGSSCRKLISICDTIEMDLICDKDLVDVNNDVCLGNPKESEGREGPLKCEMFRDSQTIMPKGFIDDSIAQEIMSSTDERLNKKHSISMKRVVICMIGVAAILGIIAGVSLTVGKDFFENKRINKNLKDKTHNSERMEASTTETESN